jgi:hypothetical protein
MNSPIPCVFAALREKLVLIREFYIPYVFASLREKLVVRNEFPIPYVFASLREKLLVRNEFSNSLRLCVFARKITSEK